ncbi:MAG: class I SAM-dependent methyltransferase [Heteroscytonema crispum UTEX LB 1556]
MEQKKVWYSPVAEAYNKARPRYPQQLISRVVELTQLPPEAIILEIGCGSGKATISFAELGYSMVCVEPNPEFYQLARYNCAVYPNVEFINT